jgi:hypothetical protein
VSLIINDPDRIAIRDPLAVEIILNLMWDGEEDKGEFDSLFEMVGDYLADEDFYQGLDKVTVIRRKSDDRLFGFQWWDDISKHGEPYYEPNGDEHGFDYELDASWYVFLPVEPFTIEAFRIAK